MGLARVQSMTRSKGSETKVVSHRELEQAWVSMQKSVPVLCVAGLKLRALVFSSYGLL